MKIIITIMELLQLPTVTHAKFSTLNTEFDHVTTVLEVLGGLPWQRETPREDPLGSGRIP